MTEIGFYHLLATPLERALPQLLERAHAGGHRVVVMAGSAERVAYLDSLLWTYSEASFLPHGSQHDANASRQPIFLTARDENPNDATMLVLVDGAESASLGGFARCCDMFDGNDAAAVEAARRRWSAAKAAGHALTYWEQTGTGWQKRGQ
ncbi:MAG TPA: DNA polymerase III subunit chi [Stellaceae bacterium]|nr:DNA polymerase III subunit chi [Stellaceae bacterium]